MVKLRVEYSGLGFRVGVRLAQSQKKNQRNNAFWTPDQMRVTRGGDQHGLWKLSGLNLDP